MWRIFLLIAVVSGCSAAEPKSSIVIETRSPAISGNQLVEPIGIETLGGVFTPLLAAGCTSPCETTQVFSTAEDNQTEISITLFRGRGTRTVENVRLGRFLIQGIPPASRGQPQIAVTVRAADADIVLLARDLAGTRVTLVPARE